MSVRIWLPAWLKIAVVSEPEICWKSTPMLASRTVSLMRPESCADAPVD